MLPHFCLTRLVDVATHVPVVVIPVMILVLTGSVPFKLNASHPRPAWHAVARSCERACACDMPPSFCDKSGDVAFQLVRFSYAGAALPTHL